MDSLNSSSTMISLKQASESDQETGLYARNVFSDTPVISAFWPQYKPLKNSVCTCSVDTG